MPILDRALSLFSIPRAQTDAQRIRTVMQERSILFETNVLPLEDQIATLRARRAGAINPWRSPSIREALGVPAIFRSVAIISNTCGSLTLKGLRKGVVLPDPDRPQIIVRPDPNRTPRAFFRDTVYSLATRGEAWWWIAKRDFDNNAAALVLIPANEIVVEPSETNRIKPTIRWGNRTMPNADMRQITYLQEPGELRGFGPLQVCGAAVSVAVESQEWAANFYADGSHAPIIIKSSVELGEDDDGESEAEKLADSWNAKGNNRPRVVDPRIEGVDQLDYNESGAQMLDSRTFQVGEAVRMLGVPASLLAYGTPGSSLTYQNVGQELDKLTRTVLLPDYLEAIEQEISDLLTRNTVARFNVDALTRADMKTRWDVYEVATKVIGVDEAAAWARRSEGFEPGDIENAPVPFSPPQAIPTLVPVQERSVAMKDIHCGACGRKVARASGDYETKCSRCGAIVTAA